MIRILYNNIAADAPDGEEDLLIEVDQEVWGFNKRKEIRDKRRRQEEAVIGQPDPKGAPGWFFAGYLPEIYPLNQFIPLLEVHIERPQAAVQSRPAEGELCRGCMLLLTYGPEHGEESHCCAAEPDLTRYTDGLEACGSFRKYIDIPITEVATG